jgi:thiamine kinase-like enzyme
MDLPLAAGERLRSLPLWSGPIEITPMSGGITNRNFLIRDGSERYVARLCRELPQLGIDRRNESACQRAAARLGLGPELAFREDGLSINRYVPGRTLSADDLRDPARIAQVAQLLRRLHDTASTLVGHFLYFCPFQTIRTYAHTAAVLNARLPADLAELLDDSRELAARVGPFRPVLCHNDLLPANIIAGDDRLWLVDWEYAGMGHYLFDLASVSVNAGFTEDEDACLLSSYWGAVAARDLEELRVFKAASALREALWAIIQAVSSELDFDYHAYAERNFEAYTRGRKAVGYFLAGRRT